jgi:hypothetical protein
MILCTALTIMSQVVHVKLYLGMILSVGCYPDPSH